MSLLDAKAAVQILFFQFRDTRKKKKITSVIQTYALHYENENLVYQRCTLRHALLLSFVLDFTLSLTSLYKGHFLA